MQQFRLISMSAMLAILTWVVADQSLISTATLAVNITPIPGGGEDMRVAWVDAVREPFQVQVTGKKAIISSLKAREPLTVRLPISSRSPDEYVLRLVNELASLTAGDLADVIVQSVDPPTMTIQVDRDKVVTMPVSVRRGALDYDVAPVVDPAEVSVTISELAYNKLPAEDRRIIVEPDEYLRTATRGVVHTEPIPLVSMVDNVPVQLDPDTVNVRFKLAEQTRDLAISAVPIKFESSLDIFNEYQVEVRDAGAVLTRPVTVRGRSEVIERLQAAGEVGFWGTISLTAADKANPNEYRYVTPRFNVPEGVQIVGDVEPVEFRLVPRSVPEPETP